jgi:hypothetical protein
VGRPVGRQAGSCVGTQPAALLDRGPTITSIVWMKTLKTNMQDESVCVYVCDDSVTAPRNQAFSFFLVIE